MTLRIAQFSADRGIAPGGTKGASLHLRGIAAGLQSLGHDVVTYSNRQAEGPFPTQVHLLEDFASFMPADVVYERYSLGHLGGLEAARRRGIPFVLEVNAPLVDEATQHRPDTIGPNDGAIEEHLLGEADLVITVSSELHRWVKTQRSGPTVMISNGFEPTWFDGPQPEPEFDLAFIGHPKPWHGADRIPTLLAALRSDGLQVSAVVIGGGDSALELVEEAQRLGVGDMLEVTGPLPPDRAARKLRTARIGLAPYRQIEPFYFCPLKVVDYLASGLAIVASNIGDIPLLTQNAALLVDPSDDSAFTTAIAELLADPSEMDRRGALGRQLARSLTWDIVAEKTMAALELAQQDQ